MGVDGLPEGSDRAFKVAVGGFPFARFEQCARVVEGLFSAGAFAFGEGAGFRIGHRMDGGRGEGRRWGWRRAGSEAARNQDEGERERGFHGNGDRISDAARRNNHEASVSGTISKLAAT